MLVVPQFAVATFTLTYLVEQRHWDAAVAGRWVFGVPGGGGGRPDRRGSVVGPGAQPAASDAAARGRECAADGRAGARLGAVRRAGSSSCSGSRAVVTVADNGLAYVSVAEVAGSSWAGRALGAHNTLQNVAAIATAPMLAAVIGESRYGWAFALTAVFPLLAIPLTPVASEKRGAVHA